MTAFQGKKCIKEKSVRLDFSDCASFVPATTPDERLPALDEVLARLAEEDPVAGRVVALRHFGGLGHEQVAAALKISVYQARQKWTYAHAWLSNFLDIPQPPARDPSAVRLVGAAGLLLAARLFAIFFDRRAWKWRTVGRGLAEEAAMSVDARRVQAAFLAAAAAADPVEQAAIRDREGLSDPEPRQRVAARSAPPPTTMRMLVSTP
jgi:hypothetical protein